MGNLYFQHKFIQFSYMLHSNLSDEEVQRRLQRLIFYAFNQFELAGDSLRRTAVIRWRVNYGEHPEGTLDRREPYRDTCDLLIATTRDPYTPVQWREVRTRVGFISERAGFLRYGNFGEFNEDATGGAFFSRIGFGYGKFWFQNWPGTEQPDERLQADDPVRYYPPYWTPSTLPPLNI